MSVQSDGQEQQGREEDDEEDVDNKDEMNDKDDSDGDDSEGDASDDLADVPDTREFEPIDLEGLQAMGLNQIGNSAMHMEGLGEEDDDASEVENVRITDTDAVVLVAKTDEVSRVSHMVRRKIVFLWHAIADTALFAFHKNYFLNFFHL